MTEKRVINGRVYLMRDTRPTKELIRLHAAYEAKYGKVDFHRWLIDRGKVYEEWDCRRAGTAWPQSATVPATDLP